MTIWMWQSGLPLWVVFLTLLMAIIIFVGLTRIVVEGRGGTDDRFVGHSCGRGIYGDRFGGDGGHGLLLCVVGRYPYFRHGFLRSLFLVYVIGYPRQFGRIRGCDFVFGLRVRGDQSKRVVFWWWNSCSF